MARGPKKHFKRIRAPKSWMLDKTGGTYAPRPNQGPHKLRECLPLQIILKNRLRYAITGKEVDTILKQRKGAIKIDGKIRRDPKYPVGLMDVLTIEATKDRFRLLYDVKGRFKLINIDDKETKFKVCKVKRREFGPNRIPYIVTHDARTIRFPDPNIRVQDTVKVDLETGSVSEVYKFESGNLCLVTGGINRGRIGTIVHRQRHLGGFDVVSIKDSKDSTFTTRINNVFVIGKGNKSVITLPKENGLKRNIIEEQEEREKRTK